MLLLNVVCFGAWDDGPLRRDGLLHGHVISTLNSATKPGFSLDWRPGGVEPGMLEREALVTYVPAHGGSLEGDGASALWGKDVGDSFSEFGVIGGRAVVLDACDTASDGWLYDDNGRLRSECQSLANKPLLGGSGVKEPQKSHGKWILGELVDALSGVEDTNMSPDDLLGLLTGVRERAATKAEAGPGRSILRDAYKARLVTSKLP